MIEFIKKCLLKDEEFDKMLLSNEDYKYNFAYNTKNEKHQLFLAINASVYVKRGLAQNKYISKKSQLLLAKDKNLGVIVDLAHNLFLDKEVQLMLAENNSSYALKALATNPSICEEVQLILVNSEPYITAHLATNPSISRKIQLVLAKDKRIEVKLKLASNSNLIKDAQLILLRDNCNISNTYDFEDIKIELAENSCICKEVQLELANDKEDLVKEMLLENPAIDQEVRDILIRSPGIKQYNLIINATPEISDDLNKDPNTIYVIASLRELFQLDLKSAEAIVKGSKPIVVATDYKYILQPKAIALRNLGCRIDLEK